MEGQMRLAVPHYVYADPIREPLSLDALATSNDNRDGRPLDIADSTVNVEETGELAEAGAAIEKFIGTLNPKDRAIVRAVFRDGRSQADIAR
jgi:DNA-directed RNA polymerase specialized sigma24 family protein